MRPPRPRSGRYPLPARRYRPGVFRRRHRRFAFGDARRFGRRSRRRQGDREGARDRGFALKVDPATLKFARRRFLKPRLTNQTLTIKEVAKLAANPAKIRATSEPGLIAHRRLSRRQVENYPNGCHVCELEIDPETGEVEILRYSVVDDVGTVLNPLLLHGQIAGGVVQGVGQILLEDIRFDPASGQLMTGSFMDYAMPRASDLTRLRDQEQSGADQDQSARRQGRRRGGRSRRDAGRRQCARRRACRNSACAISRCRRPRSASGARSGPGGRLKAPATPGHSVPDVKPSGASAPGAWPKSCRLSDKLVRQIKDCCGGAEDGPYWCVDASRRRSRRSMPMPIVNRVADLQDEIAGWRHDIHAHPELMYEVHRTAARVAEKLKGFGCDEVATGVGRTGVVGVIKGNAAGRRQQGDRPARRHGRAADRGGERLALPLDSARQDARLRP